MTDQMKAPINVRGAASARPGRGSHPRRRQFSSSEKRRILAAADRCTETGQIGALLRREGIYSSNRTAWRKQPEAIESVRVRQRGKVSERFKGRIDPTSSWTQWS